MAAGRTWVIWFFERKVKIQEHLLVPFYGRYIDDCLTIVYASSEAEALMIMKQIKFDGCEIIWDTLAHHQPFLDMMLYTDQSGKLQYMPYRKACSHQERIPWISSHPLDVKRGTFIREMSRLALLCSLHSHYIDAISSLQGIYVKRGYPQNLITNWMTNNCTVCKAQTKYLY